MVIGSLADLIRSHARRRPDAPALTAGAERLTFADLDRRSNQVGAALAAAGVAPGDRVAYLGKNTLAFFELLFGASKAGAVTVPVNWRLAPAEIADILDDSTAVRAGGRAGVRRDGRADGRPPAGDASAC